MTIHWPCSPSRGPRRLSCVVATVVTLAAASRASAAPVFKLAHDSTLVVRGVVDDVKSYRNDAFFVFSITPRTVLKGSAKPGVPILLVEERVFGSEAPYFATGAETLVFAVPLPSYSYYRQSLPPGEYWQWTDRHDKAQDIAPLADAEVADSVQAYLAAESAPTTAATELARLLASPSARVRADALDAVERNRETAAALDRTAIQPVAAVLADERVPVAERGSLLVRLARAGAPGAAVLAEPLVGKPGPLQASAIDAMVALHRDLPEARLLEWSHADDPALRLAAVHGLTRSRSRAALDRLAEVIASEKRGDVRGGAIAALAENGDVSAIPALTSALNSDDPREVLAATNGLVRIGGEQAVAALSQALRTGSLKTALAAAYALKAMNRPDAYAVLREQREQHPDPEVRRVIKLALGEKYEAHGD